jgi:autotransporter-associated beta strand protein
VVQVADAGTASTNTVALVFDGAYTFARGICVYPYTNGASVSVGSVATNSAVFSGAILLSNTVQLTSASAGTNAVIVTGVISGPGGVTKTGTGTVVLAASNLYTGLTSVAAGTLRLSSSNRIDDTSALRLTGGTFATAGFSETLGELDVDGAAVIDFGSGSSTLRFAASTGQVWAGTLTLRNWSRTDSDRLFVGTWAGALTPAQLAKIVLPDGRKAMQLATGEVVPPQGAVMMVR